MKNRISGRRTNYGVYVAPNLEGERLQAYPCGCVAVFVNYPTIHQVRLVHDCDNFEGRIWRRRWPEIQSAIVHTYDPPDDDVLIRWQ